MVQYDILLDMKHPVTKDTGIKVCQGDTGLVRFVIHVSDEGNAYSQALSRIELVVLRSNGDIVVCTPKEAALPIVYDIVGTELSVPGKTAVDVKLYDGENRVSTKRFLFTVLKDTKDISEETAKPYVSVLDALVSDTKEKLEGILEEIGSAEGIQQQIKGLQDGKSDVGHAHNDIYFSQKETELLLQGKSDIGHLHDDLYFTESEISELLNGKADVDHTHESVSHAALADDSKAVEGRNLKDLQDYNNLSNKPDIPVIPEGIASGYVRTGKKENSIIGEGATAEGAFVEAEGKFSHAEGYRTRAEASYSHAEGQATIAGYNCAHAEGYGTKAKMDCAHSEGYLTAASGNFSHAEGYQTVASGDYSHAGGCVTTAQGRSQHVHGHYNRALEGSREGTEGTAFIIGNGVTDEALSNAFRVDFNGAAYSQGAYNTSGADYAEYFEWLDGNPNQEDRRGYFVTLEGDRIRKASAEDSYILGIISAKPVVVGNSDPDWQGRFLRDEFGDYIRKQYQGEITLPFIEEVEECCVDGEGNKIFRAVPYRKEKIVETEYEFYAENPDYDPDKTYIPRSERPEWSAVGMLGVLNVRDDGTCQANKYCSCKEGGIATAAESGYRVIRRVADKIIQVILK